MLYPHLVDNLLYVVLLLPGEVYENYKQSITSEQTIENLFTLVRKKIRFRLS
jgi:hypothetical protein